MSEYQYYEWQTIDRPLSPRECAEVDGLSSHMDTVTSTRAVVTYSWGDFKHDPRQVLLQYFDAMVYLTNWSTRQLMFRFPKETIEPSAIRRYCWEDFLDLELKGNYYVLELLFDDEDPDLEWIEDDGLLDRLIPLREQIQQGDYRALYLAWLKAAWLDDPEESNPEEEPPVPPGLQKLNSSHLALIEFLDLDPHLVKAAAEASPDLQPASTKPLEKAIPRLSRGESDEFLLQVLKNEPRTRITLRKRLEELAGITPPELVDGQRTVGKLIRKAGQLERETRRREKEEAEQKRIEDLLKLARREEAVWKQVKDLIERKQAGPNDQATRLLVDLHDLAAYQKRLTQFKARLAGLKKEYANRTALMSRFERAGL